MPSSDSTIENDFLPSADEALNYLNSADTLKTLLEFIPDAVIVHHDNIIIYCNPAALELFRADSEEALVGMNRNIIVHPDELQSIARQQTDAKKNKILGGNRIRRQIKLDGEEFYSRNSFILFGPLDDPIFLVIFRDETNSIETKKAFELGEEQFRSSFEDAHICMAIAEIKGQFSHVNKAFCDKLGYDLDEFCGMNAIDITFEDDVEKTLANIELLRSGKRKSSRIEKRYISKDNRIVWFSVNAALVRTPTGEPSHLLIQAEDISDRKKAEEELEVYQYGLTQLHEIASNQDLSHDKKIENVIKLGAELFRLPVGMVGRVGEGKYTVEIAVGPDAQSLNGAEIAYEDSYCILTIREDKPLGFHNVANSPLAGRSCYEKLKFEAYFGAPIHVAGKTYGTLCFVSYTPRSQPFSEYEASLLQLYAEWIGNELLYRTTEKALRHNLDKYLAVTENAGDAIFVHGLNGEILEVNEAACSSLGYTKGELIKFSTADIEVGMSEETIIQNRANFGNDEPTTCQGIHRRKDGSTFPVEIKVSAIEIDGQECRVAIARDVSERIRSEEALKESEEKFRRIFEDTGVGMVLMDIDGTISDVNDAYCNFLGYSHEELIGQNIQYVAHPDDRKETKDALSSREKGNEVDKRLIHKNGNIVWCKLTRAIIRNSKGEMLYWLGQVQNITEQKIAEIALEERHQIQELMKITTVAANEADNAEDAIRDCLARVCEFLNWPLAHAYICDEENSDKLVSTGIWHVGESEKYDALIAFTEKNPLKIDQGVPGLVLAQKKAIWLRIANAPTIKPRFDLILEAGLRESITAPIKVGNDVVGVLEFFSEAHGVDKSAQVSIISQIGTQLGRVIERDRAQKKLIDAKLLAESGNRVKTEFLANMSHELRSPLTAILGFSESMQSEIFGPIGNDKYTEYLDNISKSAEHLHAIINDVLDISAIETGNLTINEEICEVAEIGMSAIRMVSNKVIEKDLQIADFIANSSVQIRGDKRRLKQVFVNILSNAVRFTPPEGTIKLDLEFTDSGELEISFEDTGIGMNEAGILKALSKFGQVDSALAREFEGTGLGLPLTKELVEAHDGQLMIESEVGVGTKVVIRFPPERVNNS